MKMINLKCPNCQGSLDIKEGQKDGVISCPFCGTKIYLEKDQPNINQTINIKEVHIGDKESSKSFKKSFTITAIVIACSIAAMILIIPTSNIFKFDTATNSTYDSTTISYRTELSDPAIIEFVESAFLKPVSDLTETDYSAIKYLKIQRQPSDDAFAKDSSDTPWIFTWAKSIDEKGNPVKPLVIKVKGTESITQDDIQVFTELESLNFNNEADIYPADKYGYTYFKNLKNLHYYTGTERERISNIADILYKPEDIYELGSIYAYDEEDLTALKQFTGLKYINFQALNKNFAQDLSFLSAFPNIEEISLGFSSGDTWDLAGLTSLTKLRKLSINGFDTKFEHLNILSGMPQLTELLFYDVKDLKNLDFVKNMPNLKTLHIEDCPILSLDGLKGSLSLTSFTLDGCHDLKDISALNTLTSLKTLDVAYIWNFDLNFPKLNNLTALSDVSITSDYLPALSGLSSVKKLFIYEVSNSYSFKPISNMHSLSELELRSYNWSEKPDMVSFLAKLPKLKSLIFSYGCLANTGEYSDVFSLPQVTKIKIKPVNTGSSYLSISMSRLKNNHVLKELDTGGVQIYNTDMPDSSVVNLGEYADEFLGHFPKLKKLNVSSSHIDSLEFVKKLPQLEELDISNNYVTDIKDLLKLKHLKKLNCTGNQISNLDLLPESVKVTM